MPGLKQVIILRTDLGMGKGKIAAQSAHASLMAYLEAKRINKEVTEKWIAAGMEKITLKAASEGELLELQKRAKAAKLPCALVHDAGHTQVPAGSTTALAIGPALEAKIDEITGSLKLL
ncbi:peptidyl-tRNA hydrolase [Candidatus Micrarchaeota archaeon]|nr:peptidyl-tRNA hydrolase [Candidatus Micrarchaeota archaeon]